MARPHKTVGRRRPPSGRAPVHRDRAIEHAVRLIQQVCRHSSFTDIIAKARRSLRERGIVAAVRRHDTAVLFDWLIAELSYQGIADQIAADYMERYGQATWQAIESDLLRRPSCPKLKTYWHFHDCRYSKSSYSCAEPHHLPGCPLPNHWLRNGRLNQTAFSLYLFIRDVAGDDLVTWIDRRLNTAASQAGPDRLARMREALLEPLKEIYGVSDKVLMMALSNLFLGGSGHRRRWREVGASMIAVDTLVHNFLHRTGILHRLKADHAYGPACYRPGGCDDIIETVAKQIDATQFNRHFLRRFHGSSSWPSGNTALSKVSTSATAIKSMIASAAQIEAARYTVYVIVKHCISRVHQSNLRVLYRFQRD
jgi:hypothetical protein